MANTQQSNQTSGNQKPLDNLCYDLITVIYQKSKGLEAYDKYIQDAAQDENVSSLLGELRNQDTQAVERLQTELLRVMGQNSSNAA